MKNISSTEAASSVWELFEALFKYKFIIIICIIISGSGAVLYSSTQKKIYKSEALLLSFTAKSNLNTGNLYKLNIDRYQSGIFPANIIVENSTIYPLTGNLNVNSNKMYLLLKSFKLSQYIIEKYDLLPLLFSDRWDKNENKWMVGKPPTLRDAYKLMSSNMTVSISNKFSGVLNVGYVDPIPEFAQKMSFCYIEGLSEFMRSERLKDIFISRKYLEAKFKNEQDPFSKLKIASLISLNKENEGLTLLFKYFGFEIIDPPFLPESNYLPNRKNIFLLFESTALIIVIFCILFWEFIYLPNKIDSKEKI